MQKESSAPRTAFHPLLIGLYPVTALVAHNISQVRPILTLRAVLITLIVVVGLFFAVRRLVRDRLAGALALSVFWAFFFAYGHLYAALEGRQVFGFVIGRHVVLGTVWLALLAASLWWVLSKKRDYSTVTGVLNWASVLLLALPAAQVALFLMRAPAPAAKASPRPAAQTSALTAETRPDVYYIILDAYSRDDMLKKIQGLDNSPFINKLTGMGFYVAACSQSNYGITALSLPSSLNMNYVDVVNPEVVQQKLSWDHFKDNIIHSEVRRQFEALGYKTVTFETGIVWDEITDADVYFARQNSPLLTLLDFRQVNEFETLYLRTTALRMVDELGTRFHIRIGGSVRTPEEDHHDRLIYVLDQLEKVPQIPGPKFTFLHLMSPHGPFVMGPNGEFQLSGETEGYANAIRYLDKRVPQIIQKIIDESAIPPIIIIQADHGFTYEERMAILNAYYLPGGGEKALYPEISPVNSFRVVFNQYFGGHYELLPDVSHLSDRDVPYDFEEVKYACDPNRLQK